MKERLETVSLWATKRESEADVESEDMEGFGFLGGLVMSVSQCPGRGRIVPVSSCLFSIAYLR